MRCFPWRCQHKSKKSTNDQLLSPPPYNSHWLNNKQIHAKYFHEQCPESLMLSAASLAIKSMTSFIWLHGPSTLSLKYTICCHAEVVRERPLYLTRKRKWHMTWLMFWSQSLTSTPMLAPSSLPMKVLFILDKWSNCSTRLECLQTEFLRKCSLNRMMNTNCSWNTLKNMLMQSLWTFPSPSKVEG